MKKEVNFTEGPIFGPLIKFSLPVLLALFLQAMYGAVDLLVVGQFGGVNSEMYVSAVATGSMIMQTITIVIMGLSMGLTVFIASKIGAGAKEEAGRIIGAGIWLFGIISVLITIVMVVAAPAVARLMQAPEEAFDATVTYMIICSAGMFFIVAYNLLGSIFRGIGDSKMPLVAVAIACVLNVIGDMLFVAVFSMGAAGAALATVLAQAISVVLSVLIIRRKELPFRFSIKYIRPVGAFVKQILKLGVPIALQDLLVSISFLAIMAIVNDLGLTMSAGVGVAEKVCAFLMLVPSAYMQSMSAFVAQNMGAGKYERARRALWCGVASSLAVGIFIGVFTFVRGDLLAAIFSKDAPVILAGAEYLKSYAIDCMLTAFLFCFIGYFNGCESTTFVMIQGIVGGIGVRLPMSWILSRIEPVSLFRIGLATPMSTVVQILLCLFWFLYLRSVQKKRNAEMK